MSPLGWATVLRYLIKHDPGCFCEGVLGLDVSVKVFGTSLVVQWVRLHAPKAGGPGSISGWGTRSLMHAATKKSASTTKRSRMPQLKIPRAATKTWCSLNE